MSFPAYPNYKESGVDWLGHVPEHWNISKLRYICHCLDGQRIPLNAAQRSDKQGDIPYWGANSIVGYVDEALFEEDLVLLGEDGAPFFEPSKPVAFFIQGKVWPNNHVHVLRPRVANTGKFITHVLNATDYAQFIDGSTRDKLTQGSMNDIPVPWPPPAEQTAIAAFLDLETAKIDALVAEQQRLIELLKEKRQSVISHAVTKGLNPHAPMKPSGNLWLGDVPAHWEVKRLKHIKSAEKNAFVDGPFGSNLKSEHFIEGGDVYVIESGFATQGKLEAEDLKTITLDHFKTICRSETRAGDIIIAKIGAQYGKSSILPILDKPAVVSGNSLKLTINQQACDVKYVNWHLAILKGLGVIEDIVNATAQPALSLGEMNNLPMLIPPRHEQEAIVLFLDGRLLELDTLTAEAQRAVDLLQERRTALISAAVTGQIDVRHHATQ